MLNHRLAHTWIQIRAHTSVWTLMFAFTSGMQIFRRAYPDAIIYGAFALLLALESSGLLKRWRFRGVHVNDGAPIFTAIFAGIFIYFSHRQAGNLLVFFIAFGFLLFLVLWRHGDEHEKLSPRQFSNAVYWAILGVALGLWELLAMVFSTLAHDDIFPTLSVIFVPRIDQPVVKLQFIILWLGFGLYFFEKWRRR